MGHSSRRHSQSAIQSVQLLSLIGLLMLILAGCSSRPLSQAEPSQVVAEMAVQQQQEQIDLKVTLRALGQRGWLQPHPDDIQVRTGQGLRIPLNSPNRSGATTVRLEPQQGPFTLTVLELIEQPIPVFIVPEVALRAPAGQPWQTSDHIQLTLKPIAEHKVQAQWVLRCADFEWRTQAQLDHSQTEISPNLLVLWEQFEQHIGARITGSAELTLNIFFEPFVTPSPAVVIVQWHQLWQHTTRLESPRSGAQLSGALRFGTPNVSLGLQSTPVRACR